MARLSQHVTNVNETVLKLLEQKNIYTVLDFLGEDPDKMCDISGLSFKDVIEIRRNIITKYSVKPSSGFDMYSNMLMKAAKISTGIDSLDELLEGGISTGNICEVSGLSGDGKTQICYTIATHVTVTLKQIVYFIDTKHDFSASRIQRIMKAQYCNDKEIESAMEKIKVIKINDIYKLVNLLHELETILTENPCRIIIIDSLPVLFAPFISESNIDGFGMMNNIATTMKYIAAKFHIVFLVVNLALMIFDPDDIEGQVKTSNFGGNEFSCLGDLRPALGKAWLHVPSYRIIIRKDPQLQESQRTITLVKSVDLQSGKSCTVELSDSGIVSVLK